MPTLKNNHHEAFARGIANGLSGTKSYQSAGYDSEVGAARVGASRLLDRPDIQKRIEELKQRAAAKTEYNRSWILEKLAKNAMIALGEEKLKVAKALKSKVPDESGGFQEVIETVEVEITMRDGATANRALELLGREVEGSSMFVERKEIGNPGDFANLTDHELTDRLEAITRSLRAGAEDGNGIEPPPDAGSMH